MWICICVIAFSYVAAGVTDSRRLSSKTAQYSSSNAPWCEKGGIMSSISDNSLLLWSGKGHDKAKIDHGSLLLPDLWKLDFESTYSEEVHSAQWSRIPQIPSLSPDGRWKSSGDVMGNYFFAFGGDNGKQFLNDLWVLDLRPIINSASSEVSDSNDDEELSASWINPILNTPLPHERRGHTLTALPQSRSLLLVGGRKKHEVCLPDAWMLSVPPEREITSSGGWDQMAWREIDVLPGDCRWGHSATMGNDPITNSEIVAVFGGRKQELDTHKFIYDNDLWFFSPSSGGGEWSLAATTTANAPPHRDHHTMAFDAPTHSFVLFGGRTSESMSKSALNDIWKYDLLLQSWSLLTPTGHKPETRYLHVSAMSFGAMVVFGGEHIDSHKSRKKDHKLNDLWSYSLTQNAWTQLAVDNCEGTMIHPVDRGDVRVLAMGMLLFGFLLGIGLILASHCTGEGGGTDPCDYWRPRLRTMPRTEPKVELTELSVRSTRATQSGYQSLSQI